MTSLMTTSKANQLISDGQTLLIAGDEKLLRQLRRGNWLGGTIPYFMSDRGGMETRDEVQVTILPETVRSPWVQLYEVEQLDRIPKDYRANGFSFIIIPAFSDAHRRFAKEGITWRGILDRPLVGWVSGLHLEDLGKASPQIINGQTGEMSASKAGVMHVDLPQDLYAKVNIINLFEQGDGDRISFPETGFDVGPCVVNGRPEVFSDYLSRNAVDLKLPLVADYFGAKINVSVQSVDTKKRRVQLYAPVFEGVEYRIAKPLSDYESQFRMRIEEQSKIEPIFTCNCILNYLYAELEGKQTAHMQGPITFGEIAYMLLNQTLVCLTLEKK